MEPVSLSGEGSLEKSADTGPDGKYINLKVLPIGGMTCGSTVTFKVKRNQPLKKMMNAYCENQHLMKEGLRFLHEDQRLTEEDTPMDLDMEDNDVIQVFAEQKGGVKKC